MTPEQIEIENRKYLGPTVKLLPLSGGDWAILDHNYQFVALVPATAIPVQARLCKHTERPRPPAMKPVIDIDMELDL
jgi:hypothetical protein